MFSKETYTARRDQLRKRMPDGGLILLPGNSEAPANYPGNTYHFRQDSTFLYFFGLNNPDLVGTIDADSGDETLYGNDLSMDDIIWTGPQPTIGELGASVGISHTKPLKALYGQISAAIAQGRKIHFLPPYRANNRLLISDLLGIKADKVAAYNSTLLALAVVSLRDTKTEEEIAELEKASEIGYLMHTTAMRMCRPGVVEREIAGAIEGIAMQHGAGVSFHSIVTQNGQTLHNHYHGNTLQDGKLLLVDAGAESVSNYCSDFTRTFPVNGRFTQQQTDIYSIVLAANDKAFQLSRPGVLYKDIHLEAARVIVDGLKDLGLMRGNTDAAVAAGAHALFMPHGLGHMIGMDAHDMEDIGENYVGYDSHTERSRELGVSSLRMGRRLKPGFVMTVEPGIYFIPAYIQKWRGEGLNSSFINFDRLDAYNDFGGIRIEDDILITADSNRMLGKRRVPVTVAQIEDFMKQ